MAMWCLRLLLPAPFPWTWASSAITCLTDSLRQSTAHRHSLIGGTGSLLSGALRHYTASLPSEKLQRIVVFPLWLTGTGSASRSCGVHLNSSLAVGHISAGCRRSLGCGLGVRECWHLSMSHQPSRSLVIGVSQEPGSKVRMQMYL